jgi:hypothetical protein
MGNQKRIKKLAVGSMIWSLFSGAGALLLIAVMAFEMSNGHFSFPVELLAFFVIVEALLALILWGVLRRRRLATVALSILLVLLVPITVFGVRGWAPDFIPIARTMEAVWLAPWLRTACVLWWTYRSETS